MCATKHPTAGGTGGPDASGAALLDISRLAELLECSARTVQRHVADG